MNPNDVLSLLPSLPSLEDLTASSPGGEAAESYMKLTDEEFRAALRGEVPITNSALSLPEIAESVIGLVSNDTTPTAAAQAELAAVNAALPPEVLKNLSHGYARAAALRYTYLLDTLTPAPTAPGAAPPPYEHLGRTERDAVFAHLTGRSEVVSYSGGDIRWMLRDDERREALRGLLASGLTAEAVASARGDAAAEARQAAEAHEARSDEVPRPQASTPEEEHSAARRIEETLWGFLTGVPVPLEGSERKQLLATQRVVGWLEGNGVSGLPAADEVSRQLARETLLQPFRHLTGEWKDGQFTSSFIGREAELKQLYDYLSVLPPASVADRLRRTYVSLADAAWRIMRRAGHRPLLIYGPGGVGKSSLLAKFLLDHLTETERQDRFPYAYLDFDLSSLTAREPLTLLSEAARQLATQYPASAEQWNAARAAWLEECRLTVSGRIDPAARRGALQTFVRLLNDSEAGGHRVSNLFDRGLPFLLVLDTFEELQYHDRDAIKDVFRFLNIFRDELPSLRCVMMGRAPLSDVQQEIGDIEAAGIEGDVWGTGLATDFDVIEVPLGDLDEEAARHYLVRQGISDPELAEELIEIVGASPLSLRLIVRVFRQGQLDLKSLRDETEWRRGIGDWLRGRKVPPKALLQGVLFDRILGHIHTPEVKDLAHPGLILRRVTPELIKDVLAGPCGLKPLTDQEARRYYDLLAREVSLVGTDRDAQGQDVLHHRPEIRRIMLRLMSADESKREQIRQVHENAVHYYEARPGRLAEEEALYHRLMLGTPLRPETLLDKVPAEEAVEAGYALKPGLGEDPRPIWRSLAKAADELPIAAGAYLSARLREELVPDAAWESAHPQDWELMTLARASRRARERNNVLSALEGLQREQGRMPKMAHPEDAALLLSPLPLIETALLERLDRYAEAYERAHSELARISDTPGSLWRVFQYRLLMARVAARMMRSEECESHLMAADSDSQNVMKDSSAEVIRRCERQVLRFATDCVNLSRAPNVARVLWLCLSRIIRESDALIYAPALTRHALSSAVLFEAGERREFAWHEVALKEFCTPSSLRILLSRLPPATVNRLAATLALWTTEVPGGVALYQLLTPRGVEGKASADVSDYYRKQLLDDPAAFAENLSGFLFHSPTQSAHIIGLCEALRPPPGEGGNEPDEDPFEEARLLGSLLPGEGPTAADRGAYEKAS